MKKLIFVLCLALLAGCNGCKDKTKPHRPVNQSIVPFVDFQPGDYWVYQDIVTGNIDSFFVTGKQQYVKHSNLDYDEDIMRIDGFEYPITPLRSDTSAFHLFATSTSAIFHLDTIGYTAD